MDHISRLAKMIAGDDSLPCPHCGHEHSLSDSDVSESVVSYWGDDTHDFSCFSCGKDFIVEERVTRHFTTAKTHEDLRNLDD